MGQRLNVILNCVMGSFLGVFLGHCTYKYLDYVKHPAL